MLLRRGFKSAEGEGETDEFCPRCHATLALQKGFDPNLKYWICKGCGEMLINPEIESDIVWFCDGCGAVMNEQEGFAEDAGEWKCTECGFVNKIDPGAIYLSEEEFQAEKRSPYRGLSDEAMLELSEYREIRPIDGREGIILVESRENGTLYIKKLLTTYNKSVYAYLRDNPIGHMPRIVRMYESKNCLIVIEEYIEGRTVEKMLEEGPIPEIRAVKIVISKMVRPGSGGRHTVYGNAVLRCSRTGGIRVFGILSKIRYLCGGNAAECHAYRAFSKRRKSYREDMGRDWALHQSGRG